MSGPVIWWHAVQPAVVSCCAGTLIGPSFHDIRDRYKGSQHAAYLQNRITQGGGGVWGDLPMPAMPDVGADALQDIIAWLIAGEWEEKEKEG